MHHATTTQRVPWGSPLLVLCLLAFGATFAEAQQRNWDEGASPITSWTNATNWNANDVPDTAAEDAAFNDANGDDLDCVLDSGAITIRDVLMINDYDGTLTLNDALTCRDFLWDDTGAAGNVTVSAAGSLLIGRSADFAAGGTLTNNGTLTFNGATAGTWDTKAGLNWGNVTISKTGVAVTRGGTNSTTVGVLTINSGTLDLSNTNMTASSVVINGGTLILGGATLTVTGAVTINDGTLTVDSGTLDVGGLITVGDGATAAALTVTTGQVQAGGGLSVNALDGTYTAGTGTLTFDGGGLPHNTSGGQLSVGQAGAAAGYLGLVESMRQLTHSAGDNQVPGAEFALVSGYGMINYDRGLCSAATILRGGKL